MSTAPVSPAVASSEVKIVNIYGRTLFTAQVPAGDASPVRTAVQQAAAAGANLGGADLGGADLGGADLGGANLGGANLGGTKVRRLITAVLRSDGCTFFAFEKEEGGVYIVAGCHEHHGTDSYRAHTKVYSSQAKVDETLAILAFIDASAAQPASWY